jgi:hypothetical protein
MKAKSFFFLIIFSLFFKYGLSQTKETYSGEANYGGVIGTETFEYNLKDSIKVKNGKYHFEAMFYSKGIENKSQEQLNMKADGNFKNNVPDGNWTETFVGLSGGLPFKSVFKGNFLNGKPNGEWIASDTTKSKDGIKSSSNLCNIRNGKIIGNTQYNNTYDKTWTNLVFDENGLINCCDMFVHGFVLENYRDDIDPTLGIYYHERDDKVYIVWNKFYVNLISKDLSNFVPVYSDAFANFQTRFHLLYVIDTITPIENFTFKIGYNFATTNDEEISEFLTKWENTDKKDLSLAYVSLWKGMNAYEKDDYNSARDLFIEAQKYCKECKLKEVINKKLTKVKSLIF